MFTTDYNSSQGSAMLSRFDDSQIMEQDVILTTKRSLMKEILIRMLCTSDEMTSTGFDFHSSPFFARYAPQYSQGAIAHISSSYDDQRAGIELLSAMETGQVPASLEIDQQL